MSGLWSFGNSNHLSTQNRRIETSALFSEGSRRWATELPSHSSDDLVGSARITMAGYQGGGGVGTNAWVGGVPVPVAAAHASSTLTTSGGGGGGRSIQEEEENFSVERLPLHHQISSWTTRSDQKEGESEQQQQRQQQSQGTAPVYISEALRLLPTAIDFYCYEAGGGVRGQEAFGLLSGQETKNAAGRMDDEGKKKKKKKKQIRRSSSSSSILSVPETEQREQPHSLGRALLAGHPGIAVDQEEDTEELLRLAEDEDESIAEEARALLLRLLLDKSTGKGEGDEKENEDWEPELGYPTHNVDQDHAIRYQHEHTGEKHTYPDSLAEDGIASSTKTPLPKCEWVGARTTTTATTSTPGIPAPTSAASRPLGHWETPGNPPQNGPSTSPQDTTPSPPRRTRDSSNIAPACETGSSTPRIHSAFFTPDNVEGEYSPSLCVTESDRAARGWSTTDQSGAFAFHDVSTVHIIVGGTTGVDDESTQRDRHWLTRGALRGPGDHVSSPQEYDGLKEKNHTRGTAESSLLYGDDRTPSILRELRSIKGSGMRSSSSSTTSLPCGRTHETDHTTGEAVEGWGCISQSRTHEEEDQERKKTTLQEEEELAMLRDEPSPQCDGLTADLMRGWMVQQEEADGGIPTYTESSTCTSVKDSALRTSLVPPASAVKTRPVREAPPSIAISVPLASAPPTLLFRGDAMEVAKRSEVPCDDGRRSRSADPASTHNSPSPTLPEALSVVLPSSARVPGGARAPSTAVFPDNISGVGMSAAADGHRKAEQHIEQERRQEDDVDFPSPPTPCHGYGDEEDARGQQREPVREEPPQPESHDGGIHALPDRRSVVPIHPEDSAVPRLPRDGTGPHLSHRTASACGGHAAGVDREGPPDALPYRRPASARRSATMTEVVFGRTTTTSLSGTPSGGRKRAGGCSGRSNETTPVRYPRETALRPPAAPPAAHEEEESGMGKHWRVSDAAGGDGVSSDAAHRDGLSPRCWSMGAGGGVPHPACTQHTTSLSSPSQRSTVPSSEVGESEADVSPPPPRRRQGVFPLPAESHAVLPRPVVRPRAGVPARSSLASLAMTSGENTDGSGAGGAARTRTTSAGRRGATARATAGGPLSSMEARAAARAAARERLAAKQAERTRVEEEARAAQRQALEARRVPFSDFQRTRSASARSRAGSAKPSGSTQPNASFRSLHSPTLTTRGHCDPQRVEERPRRAVSTSQRRDGSQEPPHRLGAAPLVCDRRRGADVVVVAPLSSEGLANRAFDSRVRPPGGQDHPDQTLPPPPVSHHVAPLSCPRPAPLTTCDLFAISPSPSSPQWKRTFRELVAPIQATITEEKQRGVEQKATVSLARRHPHHDPPSGVAVHQSVLERVADDYYCFALLSLTLRRWSRSTTASEECRPKTSKRRVVGAEPSRSVSVISQSRIVTSAEDQLSIARAAAARVLPLCQQEAVERHQLERCEAERRAQLVEVHRLAARNHRALMQYFFIRWVSVGWQRKAQLEAEQYRLRLEKKAREALLSYTHSSSQ